MEFTADAKEAREKNTMVRQFKRAGEILKEYAYDPARLVPILQKVQEEYRYLPEDVMNYVATILEIPPARVYGVATFYAHFTLKPKGKYVIRLCDGTACHVKASIPILEAMRNHLKLSEEKPTTDDMLFTVETVSCLGACGLAPVMLINEDTYGQVTPRQAIKLIDEITQKENCQ